MAGRCDVAVVGGGLTGLLAADRLARAGADVLLIDSPQPPAAASTRSAGLVALGWIDSPARLVAALGEPRARSLVAWSAAAVDSLRATAAELAVPWEPTGSLRVAMDPQDATAWGESVDLLQRWGLGGGATLLADGAVGALGPGDRFLAAARVPGDAVIDLRQLLTALTRRFGEVGGRTVSATVSVEAGSGAPVLVGADGERITAELVVAAPGVAAPTLHPFFRSCVCPVRVQGLELSAGGNAVPTPILARHRFESAVATPFGGLVFSGCRWADQPEMGAGETDDGTLSARVSAAQDAWLAQNLGLEVDAARRWAGIVTYTCDGLPLIGPLPGAPRVIAAVGWSGWGLALAPRAVDVICAGILGESPPDGEPLPDLLTARRLV